jgi:hypothetical protein
MIHICFFAQKNNPTSKTDALALWSLSFELVLLYVIVMKDSGIARAGSNGTTEKQTSI